MTVIGLILLVFSALLGISTIVGLLLLCFARSRLRILGLLLLALPLVLVGKAVSLYFVRSAEQQDFETAVVTERYEHSVRNTRRSEQSIVTHIQTAETVQGSGPSITVSESASVPPSSPSSTATKPSSPRTLRAVWRAFADAVHKAEQIRVDASEAAHARTKAKTASLPRPAQAEAINPPEAAPANSEVLSPKTEVLSPKTQAPSPKNQAPKPDWLNNPPRLIHDCYQVFVSTTPYATPLECSPELNQEIERAVDEYAARVLAGQAAGKIRLPMDYVRSHIVKSQYQEAVTTSVGPMVKLHALLEFDRETRSRIDRQWNDVLMVRRLRHAGGGLAGLLLVLSVAWGYLRTDVATAGAYRGRLRILATLAILTVLVVSLALAGP